MAPAVTPQLIQLEFLLQTKLREKLDTVPTEVENLLEYETYYNSFKASVEPNDRTRCPIPSKEKTLALEAYRNELIGYKVYKKADMERLIELRKESLGICDEVIIGFKDVDSILLPKYYNSHLTQRLRPEYNPPTVELLGIKHLATRDWISDSIRITNSGHIILGGGKMRYLFYGAILKSIYGPIVRASQCANSSKVCTDQNIEDHYFLSGKFEKEIDSLFLTVERYLVQKETTRRSIDSISVDIIRKNSESLNVTIDSLLASVVKRNPSVTKENLMKKVDFDFQTAIRHASISSAQEYFRDTRIWSILSHLSLHSRPSSLIMSILNGNASKGMTLLDVSSFDGYFLENATISTLPGGIEIYSFVDDEEARVYRFKHGILVNYAWHNSQ